MINAERWFITIVYSDVHKLLSRMCGVTVYHIAWDKVKSA